MASIAGDMTPQEISERLKWADEQLKELPIHWETSYQFTHPENGGKYGVAYKCDNPTDDKYQKIQDRARRSIRMTLAFPQKQEVEN